MQRAKAAQAAPFDINPGETGYLEIGFEDENGKSQPLQNLPVFNDPTGTLTGVLTPPVGQAAPLPTDPSFCFKVTCPAGTALGSNFAPTVAGTNLDGTVDSQVWDFTVPDDDTTQTGAFTQSAPSGFTP